MPQEPIPDSGILRPLTPDSRPSRLHKPGTRSRWIRLASAQESGLFVVIVLMMLGLAFASPSIRQTHRVAIPAGATVAAAGEDVVVTTSAGSSRTYLAREGYELRDSGEEPVLRRTVEVNKFLNKENLVGVATVASFIAIMAVGMSGIIIMGGIDLSIGSVYALAAVAGAFAMNALGPAASLAEALPIGLLVCCGAGAACGAINGAAVVGLRVHPFIVTLGGMAVYRGIAFVLTKGQSIGDFPASMTLGFFKKMIGGVNPVPMIFMVAVAVAGAIVLRLTVFGRRTFAIGGNETAGRYAGIPVGRVKITLFTLAGLLAGLAALIRLGYYGAVSSDAGQGYELDVIAAAVVGGASLSGGRGSAFGAMLGAVVIQLIENGIVVLGIDSNYKLIIIGLAIIIAVVVDQAKQRLTSGRG
jgi:ribose/xylose/arabinose/galactoside ABC-type transport system permease subunit